MSSSNACSRHAATPHGDADDPVLVRTGLSLGVSEIPLTARVVVYSTREARLDTASLFQSLGAWAPL